MVFNGKRETRNGMKFFTNILPGLAWPLGVTRPEAVDLNGINTFYLQRCSNLLKNLTWIKEFTRFEDRAAPRHGEFDAVAGGEYEFS